MTHFLNRFLSFGAGICLAVNMMVPSLQAADLQVTNASGDTSPGSFRDVVGSADTGQSIDFAAGISEITLEGPAVGTANLIISGPETGVVLDGGGSTRILDLSAPNGPFRLENLTFRNGVLATGQVARGGALDSGGYLNTSHTTFSGNSITMTGVTQTPGASGGAVNTLGLNAQNSVFRNNSASATGIQADDDLDNVDSSASAHGGAVQSWGAHSIKVTNTVFENNKAVAVAGNGTSLNQQVFATGGAMIISAASDITITDSQFLGNRVEATTDNDYQEGIAHGGAIQYDIMGANAAFTLVATEGNTTEFRGNVEVFNGEERKSSIYFNNYQFGEKLAIDVETEAGGAVKLFDPITIDASLETTMTVQGAGEFHWGGENQVINNSTLDLQFQSSKVMLLNDFTLTGNDGDGSYDVNFADGLHLAADLGGRDSKLAMFQQPDSFTAAGTVTLEPLLTPSIKPVSESYLVTDDRGTVDTDNFSIVNSYRGYGIGVITEGQNLYVGVDNAGTVRRLTNHENPNVRNSYENSNGALAGAFEAAMPNYTREEQKLIYDAVFTNPQWAMPEGFASQTHVGLGISSAMLNFTNPATGALFTHTDSLFRNVPEYDTRGRRYVDATGNGKNKDVVRGCAPSPCDPCGSSGSDWRLWGGYFGNDSRQYRDGGFYGYKSSLNGILVGAETLLGRRATLGAYFGYGDARTKYEDLAGRIDTDAYQFGLFGTWHPNRDWTVRYDISYGHFENDSDRRSVLGHYTGKFDQEIFNIGVNAMRDFRINKRTRFSPYLGLRYQYLDQDGVEEKGTGGFATFNRGGNFDSLTTSLGSAFAFDRRFGRNMLTTTFHADWQHEYCDTQFATGAGFVGVPGVFNLQSVDRQRDSANLGVDLKTSWQGRAGRIWTAQAGYAANLTKNYQSQSYYATLGLAF